MLYGNQGQMASTTINSVTTMPSLSPGIAGIARAGIFRGCAEKGMVVPCEWLISNLIGMQASARHADLVILVTTLREYLVRENTFGAMWP